jgi:phosphoglycolate phosphatase
VAATILFDIDGTLLFLRGIGGVAMKRAMQEEWGLDDPLAGVSFAGATDTGVAERIAPGRETRPMWARYVRHLESALGEHGEIEPLPGVVALLDALAAAGARLGILTGNIRPGAERKLRCAGLLDRFDLSLSAFAEDGIRREEIAAAARRRCGDGPVTVVGDTSADVVCARHIGARVLCVATGPQPRELVAAAGPDLLVDDLSETDALVSWLLAPP